MRCDFSLSSSILFVYYLKICWQWKQIWYQNSPQKTRRLTFGRHFPSNTKPGMSIFYLLIFCWFTPVCPVVFWTVVNVLVHRSSCHVYSSWVCYYLKTCIEYVWLIKSISEWENTKSRSSFCSRKNPKFTINLMTGIAADSAPCCLWGDTTA